jgi:hypothetical protein
VYTAVQPSPSSGASIGTGDRIAPRRLDLDARVHPEQHRVAGIDGDLDVSANGGEAAAAIWDAAGRCALGPGAGAHLRQVARPRARSQSAPTRTTKPYFST